MDGEGLVGGYQSNASRAENSSYLLSCNPWPLKVLPHRDSDESVKGMIVEGLKRVGVGDNVNV